MSPISLHKSRIRGVPAAGPNVSFRARLEHEHRSPPLTFFLVVRLQLHFLLIVVVVNTLAPYVALGFIERHIRGARQVGSVPVQRANGSEGRNT